MATLKIDTIRDAGAQLDKDRICVRQGIWLSGMTGNQVPYDALTACGVVLGGAYKSTNLYANSIQMNPVQSVADAAVVVEYIRMWFNGGTSNTITQYDGGIAMDATNVDINGKSLLVQYFNTAVSVGGPDTINGFPGCTGVGDALTPKLCTVMAARPIGQLRVSQYFDVTDDNEAALDALVLAYQGWTNSVAWRGRPKWSWLCSNIHIEQVTIKQFLVIFQFDWKPLWIGNTVSTLRGNWIGDCAYLLPEGGGQPAPNFVKADPVAYPAGNPAPGFNSGPNGYLMAQIQGATDFNALGF